MTGSNLSSQLEVALFLGTILLVWVAGIVLAVRFLRRARLSATDADGDQTVTSSAADGPPRAYLLAADDNPLLPREIGLSADSSNTLGRDRDSCNIHLDDVGISRRHAAITPRAGAFYLSDSGSRGGTFLARDAPPGEAPAERTRLAAGEERLLQNGDVVAFYTFAYRFYHDGNTVVPDPNATDPRTQDGAPQPP